MAVIYPGWVALLICLSWGAPRGTNRRSSSSGSSSGSGRGRGAGFGAGFGAGLGVGFADCFGFAVDLGAWGAGVGFFGSNLAPST
jgi:hypothetical protein